MHLLNLKFHLDVQVIMSNRPLRREVRDDDKNLGASSIQMVPTAQYSDEERPGPCTTEPGLEASAGHATSGQGGKLLTHSKPTSRQALRCSVTFKAQTAGTTNPFDFSDNHRGENMSMLELGHPFCTDFYPRESNKYFFGICHHGENTLCKQETETEHSLLTFSSKRSW